MRIQPNRILHTALSDHTFILWLSEHCYDKEQRMCRKKRNVEKTKHVAVVFLPNTSYYLRMKCYISFFYEYQTSGGHFRNLEILQDISI